LFAFVATRRESSTDPGTHYLKHMFTCAPQSELSHVEGMLSGWPLK